MNQIVSLFMISRCQLRSFLGKELVVYSFFAALLLFGIITGTLIIQEELTVNYIVFMMVAPLLFTARTAVMSECYSVRGAEYASDCHDNAKQASENPVP